jgi:hypothetical protein
MAKWLQNLEDAGRRAVADSKPPKPPAKIEEVVVTIRPASEDGSDPGSARVGKFFVQDGELHVLDELGSPLKDAHDRPVVVQLQEGDSPRAIAASLTKKRGGSRTTGFERGPLRYPPGRYGC